MTVACPLFKPCVAQLKAQTQGEEKVKESLNPKGRVCFYCKKPDRTINRCFVLNKKTKTPKVVNLVQTDGASVKSHQRPSGCWDEVGAFNAGVPHRGEWLDGRYNSFKSQGCYSPCNRQPDELERRFTRVFLECAVTRTMAAKEGQKTWDGDVVVDLSESFLADSPPLWTPVPRAPPTPTVTRHCRSWDSKYHVTCKKLVAEQRHDGSLSSLVAAVVSEDEADKIRIIKF